MHPHKPFSFPKKNPREKRKVFVSQKTLFLLFMDHVTEEEAFFKGLPSRFILHFR